MFSFICFQFSLRPIAKTTDLLNVTNSMHEVSLLKIPCKLVLVYSYISATPIFMSDTISFFHLSLFFNLILFSSNRYTYSTYTLSKHPNIETNPSSNKFTQNDKRFLHPRKIIPSYLICYFNHIKVE